MVFACSLLELCDEVLHVLALAVEFFDRFGVLALLILYLFRARLDELVEEVHEPVDVLLFVLFLGEFVDFAREVGNGAVVGARLGLFLVQLPFEQLFLVPSLRNFLLEVLDGFGLDLKNLLHFQELFLERFDLLFLGLQTRLHLLSPVRQHLLDLLQLFDLVLLFVQLGLLLLQLRVDILFYLLKSGYLLKLGVFLHEQLLYGLLLSLGFPLEYFFLRGEAFPVEPDRLNFSFQLFVDLVQARDFFFVFGVYHFNFVVLLFLLHRQLLLVEHF